MTERAVSEAVSEWVTETTPRERVHTVIERAYEPISAADIATQAETTPKTARKHLDQLAREGFVTKTATSNQRGALYKRSPTSVVVEEAARINEQLSRSQLLDRIAELDADIERYRSETSADGPEAFALEGDVDAELLYQWRSARRSLRFAKAALAISQAEHAVAEPAE